MFNPVQVKDDLVLWLKGWFATNGPTCKAIIGISGGKDSTIAAALCVEALGKHRVIGVMMPNGTQKDITASYEVCNLLGITSFEVNIEDTILELKAALGFNPSEQANINLPARIRMSTLYAVAQSFNGRVINTCNLSEDWVGYSTRYGDSVGDVSPLSNLTVTELLQLGDVLGLPKHLVHKIPTDGLCGKTDEENLGFSYAVLDEYIRGNKIPEDSIKSKIDYLHTKNTFKLRLMDSFPYTPKSYGKSSI